MSSDSRSARAPARDLGLGACAVVQYDEEAGIDDIVDPPPLTIPATRVRGARRTEFGGSYPRKTDKPARTGTLSNRAKRDQRAMFRGTSVRIAAVQAAPRERKGTNRSVAVWHNSPAARLALLHRGRMVVQNTIVADKSIWKRQKESFSAWSGKGTVVNTKVLECQKGRSERGSTDPRFFSWES
jgi:hypothetical protein